MILRSYLVAIRRQCFSLLNVRSMRFLCRYGSRPYSQGSFRLTLGGITAVAPPDRMSASILLLSYPYVCQHRPGLYARQ